MNSEQLKLQIEKLKRQLKVAEIAEHKVDLVSVVKERIKESANGITPAALDYILSPIRIYLCGDNYTDKRTYKKWNDDSVNMLINGEHEKLISIGFSRQNLANKATYIGYTFRFGKMLEKRVK